MAKPLTSRQIEALELIPEYPSCEPGKGPVYRYAAAEALREMGLAYRRTYWVVKTEEAGGWGIRTGHPFDEPRKMHIFTLTMAGEEEREKHFPKQRQTPA